MSNPLDLIDNWPQLGQGQHSQATQRFNDFLLSISITAKYLVKRVQMLEIENADLRAKAVNNNNTRILFNDSRTSR